jgi:hypothetical protein
LLLTARLLVSDGGRGAVVFLVVPSARVAPAAFLAAGDGFLVEVLPPAVLALPVASLVEATSLDFCAFGIV